VYLDLAPLKLREGAVSIRPDPASHRDRHMRKLWQNVKSKTKSDNTMKRIVQIIATGLIIVLALSCKTNVNLKTGEGFINVKGGKIWYCVKGEGSEIPIIMLHGGPGYPSYYLNPLMVLSEERPVIAFDQLGCGRSDRITDTTLMTVDSYIEQLKQLLSALKIKEYYLYGHSWGTMLGIDYYLKYPKGVKALILASPCINITLWMKDADTLISMLPDSMQFFIKQNMKNVNPDSAKMNAALDYYYNSYYTRKQPLSADIDSAHAQSGDNVYEYMWGKEEFFVSGTLRDYNRTGDLNKIKVPTLYITGEFDAARPNTVKYYQSLTPNSKFIVIKNAGHQTMHDNPKENIEAIRTFIHELEKIN
jgi:proline iminopeptidase